MIEVKYKGFTICPAPNKLKDGSGWDHAYYIRQETASGVASRKITLEPIFVSNTEDGKNCIEQRRKRLPAPLVVRCCPPQIWATCLVPRVHGLVGVVRQGDCRHRRIADEECTKPRPRKASDPPGEELAYRIWCAAPRTSLFR